MTQQRIQSTVLGKISQIRHGFGTLEEPLPQFTPQVSGTLEWDKKRPQWKQVHGTSFARVTESSQECGEVDALYTTQSRIPIGVVTADCVPILLAHRSGAKVAAVHAGWRGTFGRIIRHLWAELESQGEKANEWVAAIGPAIGPCCFQVSEDLCQKFLDEFREADPNLVMPSYRILDLPAINASELKSLGFLEVEILRMCTRCSNAPRFHSYRRSKEEGLDAGRNYSIIEIQ